MLISIILIIFLGLAYCFSEIFSVALSKHKFYRKLSGGIWYKIIVEKESESSHNYFIKLHTEHWTRKKPCNSHRILIKENYNKNKINHEKIHHKF